MDLIEPYVTLADANTFLGSKEPWNSTADAQKSMALSYARMYIDANYSCYELNMEEDPVPDYIQIANAELANNYLTDSENLFPSESEANLTKKRVKAGSVESEKEYSSTGKSSFYDRNKNITTLLEIGTGIQPTGCKKVNTSGSATLVRA